MYITPSQGTAIKKTCTMHTQVFRSFQAWDNYLPTTNKSYGQTFNYSVKARILVVN